MRLSDALGALAILGANVGMEALGPGHPRRKGNGVDNQHNINMSFQKGHNP